ncbi:MAG: helix-turn-helix domain-containing protein [Bradyrhizobium sp.]|uniref:helix-turn-helix domain-containing protein n=1 Tax=Bradyrhizobium sp. TaxID=376 RepID=UPI001DAC795D|nr:helix-turn-helix domain-containing protein [Bradyrhizobium sp.]MBV9565831.1 helix-turn-helix domain-containing protein [Bradyrhizobium sp.]
MADSASAGQRGGLDRASRADGPTMVWSTDGIPPPARFSYWRDVVRSAAMGFFGTPEAVSPGEFSARVELRSCGPLRFMLAESRTSYQIVRTRRDVANASDHYALYLQLSGETTSIVGGEAVKLHPGDIGFCEGREYRAQHGGRCAIAMVPLAMMERRAPWLRDRPHRKLASDARFAAHLRLHMMELAGNDSPLGDAETSLLAESLCNLVALAGTDGIPSRRLEAELKVEALLAFCRQNLHDPELSPQQAADRLSISVRTLHSRFRLTGRTFGQWLLENRLQGCSHALRDPRQRVLNISELAYRWGFNDLSYFNRTFRAHFDMTPREWRNGSEAS